MMTTTDPPGGGPAARLAAHLRSGAIHFNATAQVGHMLVVETLCRAGYDSVTFDVQHGSFDYDAVLRGVAAAASAGKPALVRVALDDVGFAARCLDVGAAGILAPMIDTVDDARRLVAATRYPPVGQRSWGPNRALGQSGLGGGDYLASANHGTTVFAMIETRTALDNAEAIAAVDGIDGLFVGPLDLAISLSNGASSSADGPDMAAAVERVALACRTHGKVAGVYAASPALARQWVEQGYRFVALALDLALLDRGARELLAATREQLARA